MIQREPQRRDPLDTTTEIETPEHVRFRYHVAGPAKRAVAYLLDLLIRMLVMLAMFVVAAFAGLASSDGARHASSGALLFVAFLMEWGYYVFFETILRYSRAIFTSEPVRTGMGSIATVCRISAV